MSSFNDLVFWGVNKEVLSINRMYYSKFNQCVCMHFKGRYISEDHSGVYVLYASRCSSSNAVSNFMSHQNTSLHSHCVAVNLHKVDLKITNMLSHMSLEISNTR